MLGIAKKGLAAGMNVVRMNQRNCGGSEKLTPTLYNSAMSGDYRAVIETPKGSRNKYRYDPECNCFELTTTLPEGMLFPFDFGFIPATLGDDGDPLDVLVLDWFYYTKMGEFDFAPDRFPDPAAMNKQLRDMGIQTMISVWPRFTKDSRFFDTVLKHGWFEHLAEYERLTGGASIAACGPCLHASVHPCDLLLAAMIRLERES